MGEGMLKFKVYWDDVNKVISFDAPTITMNYNNKYGIFLPAVEDHVYLGKGTVCQYTGLKDINDKGIYANVDVFKFKYLTELHKHIELIGIMVWNDTELRYEIDVYSKEYPEYVCLSYISNGQMFDFEIMGDIFTCKDLIKK